MGRIMGNNLWIIDIIHGLWCNPQIIRDLGLKSSFK